MKASLTIASPIGPLTLTEEEGTLTRLTFGGAGDFSAPGATALLRQAADQLGEYFAGTRRTFDLPLSPAGTAFQRRVWAALTAIPYGETRSYQEIAARAGCPKGFRAVGLANHRNPLPIFIPCHRVVGKDGSLTGYAGGLDRKRFLLELEAAHLVP